jgi:hypothetical protein
MAQRSKTADPATEARPDHDHRRKQTTEIKDCVGWTPLSAAFDFDLLNENHSCRFKIKVKVGGQECRPHTIPIKNIRVR